MKTFAILILLSFTLNTWAQTAKKVLKYRVIKTIHTDLNNDNKTDTIVISSSFEGYAYFNKISIALSGFKKQVFKAREKWTGVDNKFLKSNKNALSTDLLFLKKTNKHTVILLFGEIDGAGYRDEFSIINIENNNIKMVFDPLNDNNGEPDIEWPVTLTELQDNGRLCFIYKDMGEIEREVEGGDIGTYTPYFVYLIDDYCKLNEPLTKKYNEDHYVFAGIKPNEKIRIFYPKNGGKPRIWKK